MVCGPPLLILIVSGPFYALTSIRYMPWLQAASWITAFTICVALFLYGIFLLIQYFRYPKIGFGLSKRFFWTSSLLFCPAWILPVVLALNWPLRLPSEEYWSDLMPWIGLGGALMIFPLSHFIFSGMALLWLNKSAEQAGAANPCAFATSGISPEEQARMAEASRDT